MDEKEGVISNIRDLMAGVDRERLWIVTIGVMGIIFSLILRQQCLFSVYSFPQD